MSSITNKEAKDEGCPNRWNWVRMNRMDEMSGMNGMNGINRAYTEYRAG